MKLVFWWHHEKAKQLPQSNCFFYSPTPQKNTHKTQPRRLKQPDSILPSKVKQIESSYITNTFTLLLAKDQLRILSLNFDNLSCTSQ